MVLGPILGAVTGIVGALSQAGAARDATALGYENLDFQRENAQRQFDLATAEKTDAFGNVTRYNPNTNEWELALSPMQQAIVDAFQKEQRSSLTEDAGRNRNLRRTQEGRAQDARPLYEQAVSEYLYSPEKPESEGSYLHDAFTSSAIARREANKARGDTLRTAALRMGQGGDLEKILNDQNRVTADTMVSDILRSKQAARQARATDVASWENVGKSKIGTFADIMDDIGQAQVANPDTASRMTSSQNAMQAAIAQALSGASSGVGNAFGNLATLTAGTGLDLSSVANALSKLNIGGGSGTSFPGTIVEPYPTVSPYAPPAQRDRLEPPPRNPDYMGF